MPSKNKGMEILALESDTLETHDSIPFSLEGTSRVSHVYSNGIVGHNTTSGYEPISFSFEN